MVAETRAAAVVVGVGASAGLGAALCRRYGRGGLHVYVAGRTADKVGAVVGEVERAGGSAEAVVLDARSEADVTALFERVDQGSRALELVTYNAGNNRPRPPLEESAQAFEEMWRLACFGGFLVAREAGKRLAARGRGSLLFTGASGSLRGRPQFVAFAAAKAGLRMVAQSFARELGPRGVHVAHVVVDGAIDGERIHRALPHLAERLGEDGLLAPDAIAETYWQLHSQHRSAWTHELEVRPFKEAW